MKSRQHGHLKDFLPCEVSKLTFILPVIENVRITILYRPWDVCLKYITPTINKAHCTKTDRYSSLASDIYNAGFNSSLVAVEIGSRCLIDIDNKKKQTDSFVKRYSYLWSPLNWKTSWPNRCSCHHILSLMPDMKFPEMLMEWKNRYELKMYLAL